VRHVTVAPFRSEPLSCTELHEALSTLVSASTAAALLLVLPVSEAPGADLRVVDGRWQYRGCEVPFGDDPFVSLTSLVASRVRPSDRFINPHDVPWRWLRPVRSGVHTHVLGFDVLLGGPALRCDPDVPMPVLVDLGRQYVLGDVAAPCIADVDGMSLLISGDDDAWFAATLQYTGPVARDTSQVGAAEILEVVATISEQLGTPVELVSEDPSLAGDGEVRCMIDGFRVSAPVRVTGTAVAVGMHVVDDVAPDAEVPAGWTATGRVGGAVCAVSPTGWWMIVHPR
jgi:hypothetical protein